MRDMLKFLAIVLGLAVPAVMACAENKAQKEQPATEEGETEDEVSEEEIKPEEAQTLGQ